MQSASGNICFYGFEKSITTSLFKRLASGKNSKLIPHTDPTDHYYSNETFEPGRKKKFNSEKKKETGRKRNIYSKLDMNRNSTSNMKQNLEENAYSIPAKKMKKDKDEYTNESEWKNQSPNALEYIDSLGFTKEQCIADGNCFFHALELLTGESYANLRRAIVTSMRIQNTLYLQLFKEVIREKYFIGESSLEERCQNMSANKNWAGFPEKLAAAIFIGKNIFELYQSNLNFHWNVFIGTTDSRSLDHNNLQNIYTHYDVDSRHFSPLTIQNSFTGSVKIANIYFIIKSQQQDGEGVFIQMKPSELSPNHELFQNFQNQQSTDQPTGLRNRDNTCYFNALFQCLCTFPQIWNALEIDKMHVQYMESFVGSVCQLLRNLDERESLDTLQICSEVILNKIRQRCQGSFIAGIHQDPQELLVHLLMIVNEEQKNPNADISFQSFPDLAQTVQFYENFHKSNTTKLLTSYTKINRLMHSKCQCISYEGLPFLSLPFSETSVQSTTVGSLLQLFAKQKDQGEIGRCSACQLPNVSLSQQVTLEHLPEILVITLLR